jgi:integrase
MAKATPHDLRRTAATRMSELGFNRLVVDKVLNHKDQTVGGVYDRHSYDKEKLEALEAWEKKLDAILGVPKTPEQASHETLPQQASCKL